MIDRYKVYTIYIYIYTAGGQKFGLLAVEGTKANSIPLESYQVCFPMASGGLDF